MKKEQKITVKKLDKKNRAGVMEAVASICDNKASGYFLIVWDKGDGDSHVVSRSTGANKRVLLRAFSRSLGLPIFDN